MPDLENRHLTQGQIEKIAHILGDTSSGLKGSEIGFMLDSCNIQDVNPGITKWQRLYNAFVQRHNQTGSDNFILKFISKSLEPSRFIGNQEQFIYLISQINIVLSFIGLEYKDDGAFHKVKSTKSLSEAELKESEDFWINMGGKFILIRYFALRDSKGEYMGTLEVTQNIGPIQEITGEKRLVSLETK